MKFKQALLHNTGWKMLSMLFTFLNNILIVRILGVEDSAIFFYSIAVFILLSTVLKFGLENGIVYVLSKNHQSIKSITYFLLFFVIIQLLITGIILKYFVKEVAGFNFYWIVLFVVSNIFLSYVSAFYQVKKMFISLNVLGCAIVMLQTLLLTFIYFSTEDFLQSLGIAESNINNVLIISGGIVFLQILMLALFFFYKNKVDFKVPFYNDGLIKKLFYYSVLNFIITVLFFLILRTDLYFVEKYCTKVELANYLQASKIGQILLIFPGLIAGVIFPYTIDDSKALAVKVASLCRILTFLYIIILCVFLLIGQYVFTWILGYDFNLIYKIFSILFFGIYCLSISLLLISYFVGINKQFIVTWSFMAILLIILIANYLLVLEFGYLAAAIIFSVANFVGVIILFNTFKRETAIKFKQIFIVRFRDFKLLK